MSSYYHTMPQKFMNSMFDEQKNTRQLIYQRGRESSPHYVFLHSDEDSSTDEENISLQIIKKSTSPRRKIEVINVQIKPDDTLQALALRYRCTISELKQINKIDKENEIYAKPYIKVPVQPFSILTETLPENQANVIITSTQSQEKFPGRKEEQLIDLDTISTTESSNTVINTIILNSVCEPLSSYNSANSSEVSHTEHDRLLNDTENINTEITESCETDIFKCSGDNWGLSWMQLLVFSLLLSFAGPIIYILYIAEYSTKGNITISN